MKTKLTKRFLPLYIAAFFQGLVFWYSIEKLFMSNTLGFKPQGIAVATIFVVVATLIFEIPAGVLADRWSRKGVLILSTLCLLISTIIGGLSTSQWMYILAVSFWGLFFAFFSGIYESVVYDTLLEEGGHSKQYERFLGKVILYDSIGLVCGSLLSGVIANQFGIRAPYFFTIPSVILCVAAICWFKEPLLHKQSQATSLYGHLREMLDTIAKDPAVIAILLPIAGAIMLARVLIEFNQLYYIALAVPVLFFGPLNALVQSSIGLSGIVAGKSKGRIIYYTLTALIVAGSFALITKTNAIVIVIGQVTVLTASYALATIMQGKLHGMLSSKMRAGASSTANTLGQVMFLPVAYAFGYFTERYSIFQASWILVAIAMLVAFSSIKHADRAEVKA
jgi:MFS family permease